MKSHRLLLIVPAIARGMLLYRAPHCFAQERLSTLAGRGKLTGLFFVEVLWAFAWKCITYSLFCSQQRSRRVRMINTLNLVFPVELFS